MVCQQGYEIELRNVVYNSFSSINPSCQKTAMAKYISSPEKRREITEANRIAWNQAARPGRPAGGEALGLRAVFNFLRERYN